MVATSILFSLPGSKLFYLPPFFPFSSHHLSSPSPTQVRLYFVLRGCDVTREEVLLLIYLISQRGAPFNNFMLQYTISHQIYAEYKYKSTSLSNNHSCHCTCSTHRFVVMIWFFRFWKGERKKKSLLDSDGRTALQKFIFGSPNFFAVFCAEGNSSSRLSLSLTTLLLNQTLTTYERERRRNKLCRVSESGLLDDDGAAHSAAF